MRLTVPITDDPSLPVLTFRTWVLGILSCGLLAFLNRFFGFRQNQLTVSSVSAQILVLPIGKLMAATLPTKKFKCPITNWSFSFNPGPFNIKEHVLITIFASCGASGVYAVHIIAMLRAFYKRSIHPVAALLLALTTQVYLQFYISTTVTKHSKSFSTLIFIFCFGLFRCLVMGGLVYSEDTSWTLHTCGGQQTWFKFLYSGAHSSSKFHHFLNLKQHDAFIQSVKKKKLQGTT